MAGRGKEKLTKDGIQTALRLCRAGLPDCQIAAALGVRPETFSIWRNHPKTENQIQLSKAMKKADAEREAALVTRIMRASDDTWQAAAWLLERRYPDRYAKPVRPVEDRSAERDDERIKGYIDALGLR
nr:MAG TPA: hypothetical protein [Caudoviricetes sp.]